MAHAFRYLIFAGLTGGSWLARAQTPPAEQPVRFTVFCPRAITGLAFAPRAGAPPQPLVFYPTARSPHYDFRGTMPLRIVDAKSGAPVAEATVPSAISSALLILVPVEPVPAAGLRYRVFVLDDSATRQTAGSLEIINFSVLALSGTLEGKPLTLVDGLNPATPVGHAAKLQLRTPSKARTYQAYSGEIALGKNERALLLLLPPFYQGSLEVQSRLLVDSLAPLKVAPR
jgi:hypothetical protein